MRYVIRWRENSRSPQESAGKNGKEKDIPSKTGLGREPELCKASKKEKSPGVQRQPDGLVYGKGSLTQSSITPPACAGGASVSKKPIIFHALVGAIIVSPENVAIISCLYVC